MSSQPITRADWDAVRSAFSDFFGGRGDVEMTDDSASFTADTTGFSISADGSSDSFMPLHAASLGWESVAFDHEAHEVRLSGPAGSYIYVLPPDLR